MTKRELVDVHNTVTNLYSRVPLFIAEHPEYGKNLVRVDENGVPCGCGSTEESVEVKTEVKKGK